MFLSDHLPIPASLVKNNSTILEYSIVRKLILEGSNSRAMYASNKTQTETMRYTYYVAKQNIRLVYAGIIVSPYILERMVAGSICKKPFQPRRG